MRVGYISDIHKDYNLNVNTGFFYDDFYDVLVLAGDIGNHQDLISTAEELADVMPYTSILIVPGNHEYYNNKPMVDINNDFREVDERVPNIHSLIDGDSIELWDVTFHGATLWSDLGYNTPDEPLCAAIVPVKFRDMELIDQGRFTVDNMRDLHWSHKNKLDKSLSSSKTIKNVVITHFSPSTEFRNEYFPNDAASRYFVGESMDLIKKHQPDAWIYGHTHDNNNTRYVGNTKILSNQSHQGNTKFRVKIFNV